MHPISRDIQSQLERAVQALNRITLIRSFKLEISTSAHRQEHPSNRRITVVLGLPTLIHSPAIDVARHVVNILIALAPLLPSRRMSLFRHNEPPLFTIVAAILRMQIFLQAYSRAIMHRAVMDANGSVDRAESRTKFSTGLSLVS